MAVFSESRMSTAHSHLVNPNLSTVLGMVWSAFPTQINLSVLTHCHLRCLASQVNFKSLFGVGRKRQEIDDMLGTRRPIRRLASRDVAARSSVQHTKLPLARIVFLAHRRLLRYAESASSHLRPHCTTSTFRLQPEKSRSICSAALSQRRYTTASYVTGSGHAHHASSLQFHFIYRLSCPSQRQKLPQPQLPDHGHLHRWSLPGTANARSGARPLLDRTTERVARRLGILLAARLQ